METFSTLLAICAGNSPVPGEFPIQRPVTRSFDVYFDLGRKNGWVNNREAGDLRRYRPIVTSSLWHATETVLKKDNKWWDRGGTGEPTTHLGPFSVSCSE